jgi:hypothetical protein
MTKNKLYLLVILPLVIALSACASIAGIKIPGLASNSANTSQTQTAFDPSKMPIEQKLAFGTLKLEGTPQAVTAKQAASLLPLWKAVKALSSSDTTAQAEIDALYKQIQGVMTADQVQTIQSMAWTQEDMRALMTKYGVQVGGPAAQGTPQASTTRASRSQSGGGGFQGGGPGGPPPDGGGFPGGSGGFGGNTTGTPQPGQANRRAGGGINSMFVEPLIKLLQTRAAGQ